MICFMIIILIYHPILQIVNINYNLIFNLIKIINHYQNNRKINTFFYLYIYDNKIIIIKFMFNIQIIIYLF
jgi:hypothetical protein